MAAIALLATIAAFLAVNGQSNPAITTSSGNIVISLESSRSLIIERPSNASGTPVTIRDSILSASEVQSLISQAIVQATSPLITRINVLEARLNQSIADFTAERARASELEVASNSSLLSALSGITREISRADNVESSLAESVVVAVSSEASRAVLVEQSLSFSSSAAVRAEMLRAIGIESSLGLSVAEAQSTALAQVVAEALRAGGVESSLGASVFLETSRATFAEGTRCPLCSPAWQQPKPPQAPAWPPVSAARPPAWRQKPLAPCSLKQVS